LVRAILDSAIGNWSGVLSSTKPNLIIDLNISGSRFNYIRNPINSGFDMTQEEFARRVGVTQGHLSRLERGEKEPGAGVLLAISREFGKSVDWLLTGKKHGEPKKRVAEDPS
jgi:DNA-binding XRE family transcriptional regulator